ncbi:MAG: ribonuclease HII [Bacteroidales bacterium]
MCLKVSYSGLKGEAGVDEAGRGCLAGPVVAAAVILPEAFNNKQLNDSKIMNEGQRITLREQILREAISYASGVIWNQAIDKVNILNATYMAMHEAIQQLSPAPVLLIIDGNRFHPYPGIKHQCIIHGDALYRSVAAASIIAKTHRDEIMRQLHKEYPQYGWDKNKGYPTKAHKKAIVDYGITPYHRRSFNLARQLSLGI